jgi:hypothetical protein
MEDRAMSDEWLPRTDQPCAGVDWSCSDRWARQLRDGTNVYQALWYASGAEGNSKACIEIIVDRMPDHWKAAEIAEAIIEEVLEPAQAADAPYIQWGLWEDRT